MNRIALMKFGNSDRKCLQLYIEVSRYNSASVLHWWSIIGGWGQSQMTNGMKSKNDTLSSFISLTGLCLQVWQVHIHPGVNLYFHTKTIKHIDMSCVSDSSGPDSSDFYQSWFRSTDFRFTLILVLMIIPETNPIINCHQSVVFSQSYLT